ncbi:MAG: hypothetical protein J2P13_05380 [Acidobacteria bacterium]|nr:hypothetical protein [Acidobacteriota bacterium]
MSCAICETRKEKRFCPAVHGRICPQCCGEQREVTLDCPRECVYLLQAREHEKPRPLEDLDRSTLFPKVEIDRQFLHEREQLILGLSFVLRESAQADRSLRDSDLISALNALTRTYETLANSGLHIEAPLPNLTHQAIASKVQKMIDEYRTAEQKQIGYTRLRDSDVLRALVVLLRIAIGHTSGRPRSRAFVDFLSTQFPENPSATASRDETGILLA